MYFANVSSPGQDICKENVGAATKKKTRAVIDSVCMQSLHNVLK